MSHFNKQIPTKKGLLNFYFNRIYTVAGMKYHVSVRHGNSPHYFMMGDGKEHWHFSDPKILPEWIIELESFLEEAINEHLKDG
jgi:hypothetical protein